MKKKIVYGYYAFGYNYYLLKNIGEGNIVHGDDDSAIGRINEYFSFLDDMDLHVTKVAADDLTDILSELKDLPKEAKLDEALTSKIREAVTKADQTLDAELILRHAYIVTPKKFPLESLLEFPEKLFANGVFQELPLICKFDLREACKCIAYNLPTSAAFHLMRCVEATLRYYYFKIVKRGRIKLPLWGSIIVHLRKRRDKPQTILLDHLDHIRSNFRNPTQHPDARFDLDEVQDLMSLSIDVLNRMVKDLKSRGLIEDPFA